MTAFSDFALPGLLSVLLLLTDFLMHRGYKQLEHLGILGQP